jgi:hypothetical protein
MVKPDDLPAAERFAHGTRSRYVAGKCRCEPCRGANRQYYHELQRRAKEAAAFIVAPLVPVAQKWRGPLGRKRTRYYAQACPGANGQPCPNKSHLRKDSKGGVCGVCRLKLVWNGLVDAAPAREHLKKLSAAGVGRRAVHEATGVANTVLSDILSGRKLKVMARTSKEILGVDEGALADGARVPAWRTWRRINKILKCGYSKSDIAKELGYKTRALQIRKDYVLLRTEHKVKKIYDDIVASLSPKNTLCTRCGRSHKKRNRLAVLKTVLPLKFEEIQEGWPCFYEGEAGERALYRDLHELGAEADEHAVWSLRRGDRNAVQVGSVEVPYGRARPI